MSEGAARAGGGWGAPRVVVHYRFCAPTDPGETRALEAVDRWASGSVLDLGIGAGRTTAMLADRARSYVGIDIAAGMIEAARARHPGLDLRVGDARDLTAFADGSFDLVLFSFNGIDAIDRQGREQVIAELARVVRPGGRVVYSNLNLDGISYDEKPWRLGGGPFSARGRFHLRHAVCRPASVLIGLRNYRSNLQRLERGPGSATASMRAHDFRFVVHFATLGEMVAGAERGGLRVLSAHGSTGAALDPSALRTACDWVHLVCEPA